MVTGDIAKGLFKNFLRRFNFQITHIDHFGVDAQVDINRFCGENPIKRIFDVGANVGQTALRYANSFPGASIFSFEPVPTTFQELQRNVSPYPNVQCYNVAFGEKAGTTTINVSSNSETNSLLKVGASAESLLITVETLDHFCEEHRIDKIDLLKIDVEGFEQQVLNGAQNALRSGDIRFLLLECVFSHDESAPHTIFFDLHRFLEKEGYCFLSFYPESFQLKQSCLMGNALFILKSDLPTKVSGTLHNII